MAVDRLEQLEARTRYDPTDVTTLYCGTDVGVYRSTDSGATWSAFGTGLPRPWE